MHMADALISPAVGGAMWAVTAGVTSYSAKKVQNELDEQKIPLMGVMGAFVFATQMINFTIPGTGSSGHLGGGLLLAILLGPYAGFLTMASILIIQALFFADGGLLALGCNIFNMGFFTCFVTFPLIYKRIIRKEYSTRSIFIGVMLSAIVALQLGAFGVVLQALFSGKTELPFNTFLILMQPIHLAIGIVEGLVTSAIVAFVWKTRPEIIDKTKLADISESISIKKVLISFLVAAILIGGIFSWFASEHPDGLEWSIFNTTGKEELEAPEEGIHQAFTNIQEKTSVLPDYDFKTQEIEEVAKEKESKSAVNTGTTVSGLIGGVMTLLLAGIIGVIINRLKKNNKINAA